MSLNGFGMLIRRVNWIILSLALMCHSDAGRGSGSRLCLSVPGRAGQPPLTPVTPRTEPRQTQVSHPGVPNLWHWDQQNVLLSPQQEPSPKLTLIFVASFPGSSGGDDFSCEKSSVGGDQREKRNGQLTPRDPFPLPGWLPQAGRKREKGEERKVCPTPANPGTQGR